MNVGDIKPSVMTGAAHGVLSRLGPTGYTVVSGLPDRPDLYTTYGADWSSVYVSERLADEDPVLAFMTNGSGYASWKDLAQKDAGARVFKLAAEHGLENGSVVTAARKGKKIACSLSHKEERLTDADIEEVTCSLLIFLVLMEEPDTPHTGSEILYHLSTGLTEDEIAILIGKSKATVANLRKAAVHELGASNIYEAVAKGKRIGII